MRLKKYTLYIIALFLIVFCGCKEAVATDRPPVSSQEDVSTESSEHSEYPAVLYGRVLETESEFGGLLVESEDEEVSSPIVVHAESLPELSVGDRIKIEYSGQIGLSYPGQIFGARVTLEKY